MAATEWITAFDKKPSERTCRDIELICGRLRRVETLSRLPHSVISHLAHHAYYEDVDRGVTLYRQGEMGTSWYLVLTGSLEVKATQEKLSNEQIDYFKKNVKSWGAPAVAKVIGGSSEENKKGTQVLILNYTSDTGKDCTAQLETHKDGKQEHVFTCVHTGKAEGKKVEMNGGRKLERIGKTVRVRGGTGWHREKLEPGDLQKFTGEDYDRR